MDERASSMAEADPAAFDALLDEAHGALRGPGDPPAGADAASVMATYLAHDTLVSTVAAADELLHPTLPPDLFVNAVGDVLERAYHVELCAVLRLIDKDQAPKTILHDQARCYFNDWDYFLHEKQPSAGVEWLRCLRWLQHGTADVLSRMETPLEAHGDAPAVPLYEAMIERSFSAGMLRCTLSKLGDGAPWLVSGLQVRIAEDFLPAGPLLTWHDTEPFGDAPEEAEEPQPTDEEPTE